MVVIGIWLHFCNYNNIPLINQMCSVGYYNFYFGVLLYELYLVAKNNRKLQIVWGLIFGVPSVAILIIKAIFGVDQWIGDINIVLLFTVFPLVIWISVFSKSFVYLSKIHLIHEISKLSNSIYIWHHPIVWAMVGVVSVKELNINIGSYYIFFSYAFVVMLVAIISNTFFESFLYDLNRD